MRRSFLSCLAGIVLLTLLAGGCSSTPAKVRTAGTPSPCPWPDSLDAVVAAPGNHRVLLENERIRVLDVTVAPGEREPVHAHCWPSVLYIMSGSTFRDYDERGNILMEQLQPIPLSQFPLTIWMGPQAPHAIENLDTKKVHLIRVEIKH